MRFFLLIPLVWSSVSAADPQFASLSFRSVEKCFPKLADPRMKSRVTLDLLLSKVDEMYASQSVLLKSRIVRMKDGAGVIRRLTLTARKEKFKNIWQADWETVADSGNNEPWVFDGQKKTYTNLIEINPILAKVQILSDDRIEIDTKLNGPEVTITRALGSPTDMKLVHLAEKKDLRCQKQDDGSALCICK